MGLFPKKLAAPKQQSQDEIDLAAEQKVTFRAIWLGVVASVGGFMFGYVRYVSPGTPVSPSPGYMVAN